MKDENWLAEHKFLPMMANISPKNKEEYALFTSLGMDGSDGHTALTVIVHNVAADTAAGVVDILSDHPIAYFSTLNRDVPEDAENADRYTFTKAEVGAVTDHSYDQNTYNLRTITLK
jgi:hypothetical protein